MRSPANTSSILFHSQQPQKVSPVTLMYSLQMSKSKFREAQTLAEVTQLVRTGAGMQAQGTVSQAGVGSDLGKIRSEDTLYR